MPRGLPKPAVPKDNPLTKAKVELGKFLFFDKRLSQDKTLSCASCHNPRTGWTDQRPTSRGFRDQLSDRNAPMLLNAAYQTTQFWDGRAASLEEQAKSPIANPREMALSHDEAAARIFAVKGYGRLFKAAFGDPMVTIDRIVQAIASFERTLLSGNSPFDRYKAGDKKALSAEAVRGLDVFGGKANCVQCHTGPNLTDGLFHNLGPGMERRVQDMGRHVVTKQDKDRGAFKTPGLRNLSQTAPYMHDGSQATLEEVIAFLDQGGRANPWLSPLIKPLGLSDQEKKDLVAFLRALDGNPVAVEEPKDLPR